MTSVTDFTQFSDLRALAGKDRDAALTRVAGQFEALFVQEMLKSMRSASFGDPIFGGSGGAEMYRDLFDQQIADDIAAGPGVGLADLLVRQLGGDSGAGGVTPAPPTRSVHPVAPASAIAAKDAASVEPPAAAGTPPRRWETPSEFVADILPHAREVAARLGVSPLGVLAQAALETGWGQHVMPGKDGENSLNLFGIKADDDWQGDTVKRATLEFENGTMQQRREPFRSYGSLAETFDDYGALIADSPRYTAVRRSADDIAGFADALQSAGYATDPDYAAKIRRVAGGATMQGVLGALKETDLLSLATHVR